MPATFRRFIRRTCSSWSSLHVTVDPRVPPWFNKAPWINWPVTIYFRTLRHYWCFHWWFCCGTVQYNPISLLCFPLSSSSQRSDDPPSRSMLLLSWWFCSLARSKDLWWSSTWSHRRGWLAWNDAPDAIQTSCIRNTLIYGNLHRSSSNWSRVPYIFRSPLRFRRWGWRCWKVHWWNECNGSAVLWWPFCSWGTQISSSNW